MTIWIQVNRAAKFMDFVIKMPSKWSYSASHYVNDRMRNAILFDMFTASFQRSHVIIDCLCGTNLWNINLKAMCIMKFKFMVIDFSYALKFALIHTPIAIGFASNVILNIVFILVILCKFIYKRFVSSVGSHRLSTY